MEHLKLGNCCRPSIASANSLFEVSTQPERAMSRGVFHFPPCSVFPGVVKRREMAEMAEMASISVDSSSSTWTSLRGPTSDQPGRFFRPTRLWQWASMTMYVTRIPR